MPLTPEANLSESEYIYQCVGGLDSLDQFFGLDIVHSVDSSNSITLVQSRSV